MRNINKPTRYKVAPIQAQQTLGGDVMQADENGQYVEWRDYKWLLDEVERLRKAGDAMAKNYFDTYWSLHAESTSRHEPASITNWEEAKENR